MFARRDDGVELRPGIDAQPIGQRRRSRALDERFGGHRQPRMAAGDVEVMHDVAVVILVHHHARRRRRAEPELDAALRPVAARLHARLHHALGDRRVVGEPGDVPDGVVHGVSGDS